MASVTKRKWTYNGVEKTAFVVRYVDQDGKRCQKTFDRFKVADKYRIRVESEVEQGTHVSFSESISVREAAELWIRECERRVIAKDRMTRTSLKSYQNFALVHVCGRFGDKQLIDLKAPQIQTWLNELSVNRSKSFLEACRNVLGQIIAFAFRMGKVGRNVLLEGRVRTPQKDKERVGIPSLAELRRVMDATDERGFNEKWLCLKNRRVIVRMGVYCGLRRGEMAGLQWENIDFDKQVIQVRHSMSLHDGLKAPKTRNSVRDLHIPPQLLLPLKDLHRHYGYPASGFVLKSTSGTRFVPSQIYRLWTAVARKAEITDQAGVPRYHLHALRHSAASMLIAEGATPLHVKAFMGHASITTTMDVYGHLFPEDDRIKIAMRSAADKLSAAQDSSKAGHLTVIAS